MKSVRPDHDARRPALPAAIAPLPGDPIDPARARQGATAYGLVFAGGVLLFLGSAVAGLPPFSWSQGLVNRLFGHDSVVLAGLPIVALLVWLPRSLLGRMERRPDRPFLCGAQDAVDPKRNPNWRARLPSPERQARTLLHMVRGALVASLLFAVLGGVAYRFVGRPPVDAGSPLPRRTPAELAEASGADRPDYVRIVGAAAATDQAWHHFWNNRQTSYEDVYLPIRAANAPAAAPVRAIELASYPGSGAGFADDPPVSPIEGAVSRARFPGWMRLRMREAGFVPAEDAVLIRRMPLRGRVPGGDAIGAGVALAVGLFLAVFALIPALAWTFMRRRLLRAEADRPAAARPRRGRRKRR